MAKDDYFVLAYILLKYLYKCLKSGARPDYSYLNYETKDFPITEEYWNYLLENLCKGGYIEGVVVIQPDNAPVIIRKTDNFRIAPHGIEYLLENSMMKKAANAVKEISGLIP